MKSLLVCDWIERYGGAEQVLKQILSTSPDLDIYTLWNSSEDFNQLTVFESRLSRGSWSKHKSLAMPLMIPEFSKIRVPYEVERLIVSSHSFAHHATIASNRSEPLRYTYVHTPARYIWSADLDIRGRGLLQKMGGGIFKRLEKNSPVKLGKIAANSKFVATRVYESWGIQPDSVIYPPVRSKTILDGSIKRIEMSETDHLLWNQIPDTYVVTCGRLVAYKEHEKAIRVAKILGLPLVIAGSGPDEIRLLKIAQEQNVLIYRIQRPSDTLLHKIISNITFAVFGGIEDFGIMTVEALALGARILVNPEGGSGEIVEDSISGAFTDFRSDESIKESANRVLKLHVADIKARSLDFDENLFRHNFEKWISKDE